MVIALGSRRHRTRQDLGLVRNHVGKDFDAMFGALQHGKGVSEDTMLEFSVTGLTEWSAQWEVTEQTPWRRSALKLALDRAECDRC
jgi:hypothetical protein